MKLTIGRRLGLLVALEFAALALVLALAGSQMREALMSERRLMLQQLVDTADSIVKYHAAKAERGELSIPEAQAQALAAVSALRFGDNNYVWVNDFQLQMLEHPNAALRGTNVTDYADAEGKRFFADMLADVKRQGEAYIDYQWRRTETAAPALKISYARATTWNWILATGMYADDVGATALQRTLRLAGLLAIVAIALLGLTGLLARSITRPLRATVASLEELADGDCDLSRELPEHNKDELGDLSRAFNAFVRNLRGLISETRAVAARVTDASEQSADVAGQVTGATQAQAAGLEQTAASLEQITATVKQNADSARQVNEFAVHSLDAAQKGGAVVGEAVAAMQDINAASRKIADIITTIDSIAFQTNLLALNAAVEAARAGEHGRGFAVVASEVQSLAQRSASAAREIKVLIQDSVAKVSSGTELVNRSGSTLAEIIQSVRRVTEIVASIATASEEQSAGVDQVNTALSEMDQGVQQTALQIAALSDTAATLSSDAAQLAALVGRFKLDTNDRVRTSSQPTPGADAANVRGIAERADDSPTQRAA